jgi:hypothetical protein
LVIGLNDLGNEIEHALLLPHAAPSFINTVPTPFMPLINDRHQISPNFCAGSVEFCRLITAGFGISCLLLACQAAFQLIPGRAAPQGDDVVA